MRRFQLGTQPFHDPDWLREQIEVKQRTFAEVAVEFGVTKQAIMYFARKYKVHSPNPPHTRKGTHAGAEHYRWKGGVAPYATGWPGIRDSLKRQAGYTCQQCGHSPDKPNQLHVHHIDGNKKNHSLANLIVLCLACHAKSHQQERKAREQG